jgi:hypothetical protein
MMLTSLRSPLLIALLAASVAAASAADAAQESPGPPPATLDATVKLSGGVLAAGVGYEWGHGTLLYQGQKLKFCIHGLSVGNAGVVSVDAQGNVYNLKSPDDFAGKYFALSGGFAIARGESAAILKNKRGVMMELETLETGLQFNISAMGLKIVMAGQRGCKT